MTNPVTDVVYGRESQETERKVYVRSDDAHSYTGVTVGAYSTLGDADINPILSGATGWGIKLLADAGHTPTQAEWDAQSWASETEGHITLDDISDSDTYVPFWYKLVSPARASVGLKTNISFVLMYKETV